MTIKWRSALPATGLILTFTPVQAYAQVWKGPCDNLTYERGKDLKAGAFGTWAAQVAVQGRDAPCRYRGESVWDLYELFPEDGGALRGKRTLKIRSEKPRKCHGPLENRLEVEAETEREGDQCLIRLNLVSTYSDGRKAAAEITSLGADQLTVTTPEGASTVYRRRRRDFSVKEEIPTVEKLHWSRSCGLTTSTPYLGTSTEIFRQGADVPLRPMVQPIGYGGPAPLPPACISRWEAPDPALARLSPDGRTLSIAKDAPPGSRIKVSYIVGDESFGRQFEVIAADAVVLTGTRSQKSVESCPAGEPVRELAFHPNGRFGVTFVPFETYVDYWGTYRFDQATGALKLAVEGGNYRPPFLDLEGTARFEGERLVLDGFYLGDRNGGDFGWGGKPPSCRYTF